LFIESDAGEAADALGLQVIDRADGHTDVAVDAVGVVLQLTHSPGVDQIAEGGGAFGAQERAEDGVVRVVRKINFFDIGENP
jgi:hypothetical protein